MVPYKPLSGSSFIPLPSFIAKKKAVVNIKNYNDHECFKWSVTEGAFPREVHPERLNKKLREKAEKFNWDGCEFPMQLNNIDKFERQNDYGIFVLIYDEKSGFAIGRTTNKDENKTKIIDLLLIQDENDNTHYCLIKNLSRLISHLSDNTNGKRYFCRRCLYSTNNEKVYKEHKVLCKNHAEVRIQMPDNRNYILKFKNYHRKMRVPFAIYADFECFLEKISTCKPSKEKSYNHKYQHHNPSGFGMYTKCFNDNVF